MWTRARIRASLQTSPISLTLAQASRNRKSAVVVSKNFPMERHRAIAWMCLAGSFLALKQKSKRRSGEAARKFKSVSRCFHTIYTAKFMDPESSLNLTYWEINYTGKKTLFLPSTYTTNNISQWSASRRTPVKHSSSAFLWFIFAHDVRNVKCIRSLSHDAESLRIVNL